MQAKILKSNGKLNVAKLMLPTRSECCLSVCGGDDAAMNGILRKSAESQDAVILDRLVFAGREHYSRFSAGISPSDGHIVWLQGDACHDGEISSMQAFAISGMKMKPVVLKGRSLGFCYEDEYAYYCRLSGITPANIAGSKEEQAREVFEIIQDALEDNGFDFTNIVRTWFYNERILDWYKEFNSVRTEFFNKAGTFDTMVPASTGIGAANALGSALVTDVIAVKPKSPYVKIQAVPSPMQGSALSYKSSFSRAVEMSFPTHRTLFISGTASIDREGNSMHIDDCRKQIDLTMQVVKALLESRGMDWTDLFRGIAYFRNISDRPLLDRYCRENGIPKFPLAVAHADICRKDLLFEIEADAIRVNG